MIEKLEAAIIISFLSVVLLAAATFFDSENMYYYTMAASVIAFLGGCAFGKFHAITKIDDDIIEPFGEQI